MPDQFKRRKYLRFVYFVGIFAFAYIIGRTQGFLGWPDWAFFLMFFLMWGFYDECWEKYCLKAEANKEDNETQTSRHS